MKYPFDRGGLRFYLVILALAKGAATHTTIALGIPLIVLGAALHFWAKGCLRQNQVVAMTGPYRFVRHPFYTANLLIDAAIALMSGWWVLCAFLPVWWLSVYIPVMRREEGYLTGSFGPVYENYKKRVPALIPLRRPLKGEQKGFSWTNPNIATGNEIPRALRLLAYPLLFFVVGEVLTDGTAFLTDNYCLELWALSVLILVYALAWELKRHLKHGRRILPRSLNRPGVQLFFVVFVLVLGFVVHSLETDIGPIVIPAGAAIVLCSAGTYLSRRTPVLISEGLALVGVTVLYKLLWLSVLPALFYTALVLDTRLSDGMTSSEPEARRFGLGYVKFSFYNLILLAGTVLAIAKEVIPGYFPSL